MVFLLRSLRRVHTECITRRNKPYTLPFEKRVFFSKQTTILRSTICPCVNATLAVVYNSTCCDENDYQKLGLGGSTFDISISLIMLE